MTCTCEESTNESRTAAAIMPFDTPFPVTEHPPAEWFQAPPPELCAPGRRLTVTDEGRVYGYFWEKGTEGEQACIVGHPGYPQVCTEPTPSPTGYAAFHQNGPITLADGSDLDVGVIGAVGGHASPYGGVSAASKHYADPSCQRIACLAHDTEHGALIAGALVQPVGAPALTYGDVAGLRRCALSGDWREMDPSWFRRNGVNRAAAAAVDYFDCIGPTLVTRPGLPLVRAYRAASMEPTVLLGGVGGVHVAAAGDPSQPYGNVGYGDPGYQDDERKRYPIDTAEHVRAAWSYINQPANRKAYSEDELARIEGRIKAAAARLGVTIGSTKAATMQAAMLPDGTTLEVPDGAVVTAADGKLTVEFPAAITAAAEEPFVDERFSIFSESAARTAAPFTKGSGGPPPDGSIVVGDLVQPDLSFSRGDEWVERSSTNGYDTEHGALIAGALVQPVGSLTPEQMTKVLADHEQRINTLEDATGAMGASMQAAADQRLAALDASAPVLP